MVSFRTDGAYALPVPSLQPTEAVAAPTVCAWCGASDAPGSLLLAGRRLCGRCGTATTHPWPSEEELADAYEGWYRPGAGRFAGPGDALLRRSRGRLAGRLDALAPRGPVLDVGAGEGALLDALKGTRREALGLERRSLRPDVREAELDQLDGPFAAIVFWHSLEHLPEPRAAIRQAASLLAPGGVLVVALPNADSLQARAFGDRWFALDLPRHLVHVPAGALRAALSEDGLNIERESHVRGGQVLFGWLHGLVGALPGHHDLYDAIRLPAARRRPLGPARRAAILAAAAVLAPVAAAAAGIEVLLRRGGSVYVEARRD
jgi:SAM-dependent methyltransferase